jgi:dTDP-4-dehydrorhamnose 3,5-epimerase and related enzymes
MTTENKIAGVIITPLTRHSDPRGWLSEIWRNDEFPAGFNPAMGYVSLTCPGVVRGPHEHREQSDFFVFLCGKFKLHLWDNRSSREELVLEVGEANPVSVLVPPEVVHAYENVGLWNAVVLNFPDRLYTGWGRAEAVDEIRYENDSETRFQL